MDRAGSKVLHNSLMYKMCYYRFGEVYTDQGIQPAAVALLLSELGVGKPGGYDRVRNSEIGFKDFELDVLEEAFTTEHWLVRIYKVPPHYRFIALLFHHLTFQVKKQPNLGA